MKVQLQLVKVKTEFFLETFNFKILNLCCSVYKKGVEAAFGPRFLQCGELRVQFGIESMYKEDTQEYVIRVKSLSLLLLLELLLQIRQFVHRRLVVIRLRGRC